jgi:hypothetical protein
MREGQRVLEQASQGEYFGMLSDYFDQNRIRVEDYLSEYAGQQERLPALTSEGFSEAMTGLIADPGRYSFLGETWYPGQDSFVDILAQILEDIGK